jgi:dipeptidase D
MNSIKNLHPQLVFKYFDEILQIPRPSKQEQKIIAYLENFAKEQQLEYKTDDAGNVLIKKKASMGFENRKGIILQSHSDMVCEKNADFKHDFENDPIPAFIDGDWIKSKGTTLGADDGIGMAAALAVLADKELKHGPIECLFTSDEETGMTGAIELKPGFLEHSILLNLDSEDEGQLFMGCAGGMDTEGRFNFEEVPVKQGSYACKIMVSGLKGGHSGDEINKKLGNSIKLLVRLLSQIDKKTNIQITEISGGNLRNAIPREAYAIISTAQHKKEEIRLCLNTFLADAEREYIRTEPDLKIEMETCEIPLTAIDENTKNNLLLALQALHHGVFAMSQTIDALVETSSNLASVKKRAMQIIVGTSQRSSLESAKKHIAETIASTFRLAGAEIIQNGGYPGWEPNPDSEILKITEQSYKSLFGKTPEVKAIHAGLECGLFLTKFPQLDMVSFGPSMKGAHSPDERLYIPSVEKFWKLLLHILENAPVS